MNMVRTISLISVAIQLLATVAILVYAGRALIALALGRGIDFARHELAEGVLVALGFALAATLLNVIGLGDWTQIRTFAAVFLLRTLLKQVFVHEQKTNVTMKRI